MNRPMRLAISLLLIVAMTVLAIAPAVGVCETKAGSKKCCGHCVGESGPASCCSKAPLQARCRCSVGQERPAPPQERRTSDERLEARRVVCLVTVLFGDNEVLHAQGRHDATLLPGQLHLSRQVLLCRWLI